MASNTQAALQVLSKQLVDFKDSTDATLQFIGDDLVAVQEEVQKLKASSAPSSGVGGALDDKNVAFLNADGVTVSDAVSQVSLVNVVGGGEELPVDDNTTVDISLPVSVGGSMARGSTGSLVSRWTVSGLTTPADADDTEEVPLGPNSQPVIAASVLFNITDSQRAQGSTAALRKLPAVLDGTGRPGEDGMELRPFTRVTGGRTVSSSRYTPELLQDGRYTVSGSNFWNMHFSHAQGSSGVTEEEYSGNKRAPSGAAPISRAITLPLGANATQYSAGGVTNLIPIPFEVSGVRIQPFDVDSGAFLGRGNGVSGDNVLPVTYGALSDILQTTITRTVGSTAEVDLVDSVCITEDELQAFRKYIQDTVALYPAVSSKGITPATVSQVNKWLDANVGVGAPFYHGFFHALTPQFIVMPLSIADITNAANSAIPGGARNYVDALPAGQHYGNAGGFASLKYNDTSGDVTIDVLNEMISRAATDPSELVLMDGTQAQPSEYAAIVSGHIPVRKPFFSASVASTADNLTGITPAVGSYLMGATPRLGVAAAIGGPAFIAPNTTGIENALDQVINAAGSSSAANNLFADIAAAATDLRTPSVTLLDAANQATIDPVLLTLINSAGSAEAAVRAAPFTTGDISAVATSLNALSGDIGAAQTGIQTAVNTAAGNTTAGAPPTSLTPLLQQLNATLTKAVAILTAYVAALNATVVDNKAAATPTVAFDSLPAASFTAPGVPLNSPNLLSNLQTRLEAYLAGFYFSSELSAGATSLPLTPTGQQVLQQYDITLQYTVPASNPAVLIPFAEVGVNNGNYEIKMKSSYKADNMHDIFRTYLLNSPAIPVTGAVTPALITFASLNTLITTYSVVDLSSVTQNTIIFANAQIVGTAAATWNNGVIATGNLAAGAVSVLDTRVNYHAGAEYFVYAHGLKYVQDKDTAPNASAPLRNPRPFSPEVSVKYFYLDNGLVHLDAAVMRAHSGNLRANAEAYKMQTEQSAGLTSAGMTPRFTHDTALVGRGNVEDVLTTHAELAMMPDANSMPKPAQLTVANADGSTFTGTVYSYCILPALLFQFPFSTNVYRSRDNVTLPADACGLLNMRMVVGQASSDGGSAALQAGFVMTAVVKVSPKNPPQIVEQRVVQTGFTEAATANDGSVFVLGSTPGASQAGYEFLALQNMNKDGINAFSAGANGLFGNRYASAASDAARAITSLEVINWINLARSAVINGTVRPAASLAVESITRGGFSEMQFVLRVASAASGRQTAPEAGGESIFGAPSLVSALRYEMVSLRKGVVSQPEPGKKFALAMYDDCTLDKDQEDFLARAAALGYNISELERTMVVSKALPCVEQSASCFKRGGVDHSSGANIATKRQQVGVRPNRR